MPDKTGRDKFSSHGRFGRDSEKEGASFNDEKSKVGTDTDDPPAPSRPATTDAATAMPQFPDRRARAMRRYSLAERTVVDLLIYAFYK